MLTQLLFNCIFSIQAIIYSLDSLGGIPSSMEHSEYNSKIINNTLMSLKPYDSFMIPNNTYYLMGGIRIQNIRSVNIINNGYVIFSDDINNWPRSPEGFPKECMYFFQYYKRNVQWWWDI